MTAGTGITSYTVFGGSTTSDTLSGLIAGDTYAWFLYAYDGAVVSPPSATYYFTAQTIPSAPVLSAPGNSTSPGPTVSGTSQTFQWGQVGNATSYQLDLQNVTAGTPITDFTISSGATTSDTLSGLTTGDTYAWYMYAFDGAAQSPPSATYYFTIQATVAAPVLIGPGSTTTPGPTVIGTSQTFQWDQFTNATSYLVELQNVTTGTGLTGYPVPGGTTTSDTISGLTAGDTYAWFMYAYDGSVASLPSPLYYLTIQPIVATPVLSARAAAPARDRRLAAAARRSSGTR